MGKKREERQQIIGVLDKNMKGFGFVRQEDGDIFIGSRSMNGAMHGDTVSVDLLPEYLWDRNPEGMVHKVLKHANTEIVGILDKRKSYGFVIADEPKIIEDFFISKSFMSGAKDGDKVLVQITKYPTKDRNPEGKIIEIIARKGETKGAIKGIARSHGLRETFPSRVNAEAKARSKEPITERMIESREDLRDRTIVTIDGPYSKDLDDAVSVSKLENGNYLLGVHIADVSHYVDDGKPLDREALKRGNSVYLLNMVIPMLPPTLSNGICSLNQGEDRLTLSCEMEIDKKGNIVDHRIFESVINSKARLVYDDVSDILENHDEELLRKYKDIADDILLMGELAAILREKRDKEGSLDFDFDESEIILDDDEIPIEVGVLQRRTANKLIEDFMLAANKTVAEHFYWMDYPFVYRVHEKPDNEKIQELKAFLAGFGIPLSVNPENIHPSVLAKILKDVQGETYENIVATVMLRSMKKAFYSPDCEGHFGLAFPYYCHFTSPIRRYPDLMIHRIIKACITGKTDEALLQKFRADVEVASEQSSLTERAAQETEREAEKMKKAQYMQKHIGEQFDGIVSGVAGFGIFVQLPNTIEGMVPLESMMDDYYIFEKEKYRVIGERTHKIYALGDKVKIEVVFADPKRRIIDFKLV